MNEVTTFSILPIVDAPIPDNVIVPCPKIEAGKQVKRFADKCRECECFRGLAQRYKGEPRPEEIEKFNAMPWSLKYAIRCAVVMEWACEDIG